MGRVKKRSRGDDKKDVPDKPDSPSQQSEDDVVDEQMDGAIADVAKDDRASSHTEEGQDEPVAKKAKYVKKRGRGKKAAQESDDENCSDENTVADEQMEEAKTESAKEENTVSDGIAAKELEHVEEKKTEERNRESDSKSDSDTADIPNTDEVTVVDEVEGSDNEARNDSASPSQADDEKVTDEQPKSKKSDKVEEITKRSNPPKKKEKVSDEPLAKKPKSGKVEDESKHNKKRSLDLAKFWKAVEDDPTDFTGWTYLLQFVDTTGDIDDGREAYDAFLFRYPYCYGYWKKFADLEKRKGDQTKCMNVFERGIKAISLSADLWIHYLNHVKTEFSSKPDFVRIQYERAIEACGKEWRSDKLWDHFVKWEVLVEKEKDGGTKTSPKNYSKVMALYDRILKNPTQGLSHQFDMFKDFVKEHEPRNLLDVTDFLALRKDVLSSIKKSEDTDSKDAPGEEEEDESPASEEENTAMKEKIISTRKKVYKATEEKVQLRWKYEDAIKRPYFHMKPLERGQLKNWSEYLEFEENLLKKKSDQDKDFTNLTILFERCMIACALYEEFWMKYADWLLRSEKYGNSNVEEKVREVYKRACTHHMPDKVDVHLSWAAYEETKGQTESARSILENLQKKHPELMSVILRRINLERRVGNVEKVHELYKSCIANAKSTNAKIELSVKYARFLRLIVNDNTTATNVLQSILDNSDGTNAKIFMQLLDVELHIHPLNAENVIKIFDAAIATKAMPSRQKLLFSQRKIEFLEDFGPNVSCIQSAKDDHEKLTNDVKKEAKDTETESEKTIETIEGKHMSPHDKILNDRKKSTRFSPQL